MLINLHRMETTKSFFDAKAGIWDEITRYNCADNDFRRFVSMIGAKRGKKVVDLGCGTGVMIPYLQEAVGPKGKIFAVDISDKMLEILARKHPYKNVLPLPVSAEKIDEIPARSTEGTICFCAFPHFEDKNAALGEIARITRKGGKLLISHLESREDLNNFHKNMEDPVCSHNLPDYDEMSGLLKNNGFGILHYLNTAGRYELLAQRQ